MPNHAMTEEENLITAHYHFNEALNKEKLFKIPDRVYFNVSELSVLPGNWVQKLVELCNHNNSEWLNEHLVRHLDESYSSHQGLKEKLSLIYYRLTGELDIYFRRLTPELRHDMVAELTEDIGQCTVGFHSRVERITASFFSINSFDDLLYRVREYLVREATYDFPKIHQGIHIFNRIKEIASISSLGIIKNIEEDPDEITIYDEEIKHILQNVFEQKYTPCHLLFYWSKF